ncbi:MAG: alpha/beta hydrolase [Actinocatenispora sp.]
MTARAPAGRPTQRLSSAHGATLEYLVTGEDSPTTVFAHGLGGGIPDTRPLGSAVTGRKAFLHLRGHGGSVAPSGDWTYQDLATDLRAVADEVGATRALGISLGASALLRLLAETPDRFDRLVFFLPAVLDQVRTGPTAERLADLARAVTGADRDLAGRLIASEVPAAFQDTPPADMFVAQRVATLFGNPTAGSLASLAGEVPLPPAVGGADVLRRVEAPTLVLACDGDPHHPTAVAQRLAAALPNATLHVYAEPGVLWTQRADLRDRVSTFLNA